MYTTRSSKPMLTQQQRNHRRKRATPHQLAYLQKSFAENPKPDQSAREAIGRYIDMTPRSVQIWFQNNRAKKKHQDRVVRKPSYSIPMRAPHLNIPPSRFGEYSDNVAPVNRAAQGSYDPRNQFNEFSPNGSPPNPQHYNYPVPQYPDNRMRRPNPNFSNSIPYQSRGGAPPPMANIYESQGNAVYRPEASYINNDTAPILNYENDDINPYAYPALPNDSTSAALDRLMLGDGATSSATQLPGSDITDLRSMPLLPANEILKDTSESEVFASNFEEPENDLNIDDFLKPEATDSFNPLSTSQTRSEFSIF